MCLFVYIYVCVCVFFEIKVSTNNLFVKQKNNKNRMTRKSNVMYDSIHIDPVYIVVSILIKIVVPLNIRRSLLNQIIRPLLFLILRKN